MPPRLLRERMNSRMAMSGLALGSRIFWNLHPQPVAPVGAEVHDPAQLIVVEEAGPRSI